MSDPATVSNPSSRQHAESSKSIQCQPSLIIKLPPELLEQIFEEFVHDGRHSPIVLAHVCRLWREITDDRGSLWRHIDLQMPGQAKHHLIHSHWHTVDVVWLNRSYGPGARQGDYREWLWSSSYRFASLSLVHKSEILSIIFRSIGTYLPELVDLTVIGQDMSLALRSFVSITAQMPRLKRLNLSRLTVTSDDLAQLLSGCSALEKIELIGITTALGRAVFTAGPRQPSISLPKLEEMSLVSLHPSSQCIILSRLIFPPRSSLRVTGAMNDLHFDTILHPDMLLRFRPCFTAMTVGNYSVLLSEPLNDQGCALTLEVLLDHRSNGTITLPIHSGDLDSVQILEFTSPAQQGRFNWRAIFNSAHALETVRLRDDHDTPVEMTVAEYRERYMAVSD
ncbi:F-box protein [Phanerochaete sordida]|uniref:F-box protein n=1 Tax=Phanerochaete sordida TaxID=48140 RepID=A0A9P3GQF0_9APHY|nr:F-box protein [Phanerochaete sordida]